MKLDLNFNLTLSSHKLTSLGKSISVTLSLEKVASSIFGLLLEYIGHNEKTIL